MRSKYTSSDFIYKDFHDTTGLKFVQIRSRELCECIRSSRGSLSERGSVRRRRGTSKSVHREYDMIEKTEVQTNPHDVTNDAFFGHRDDFEHEPLKECPVRVS